MLCTFQHRFDKYGHWHCLSTKPKRTNWTIALTSQICKNTFFFRFRMEQNFRYIIFCRQQQNSTWFWRRKVHPHCMSLRLLLLKNNNHIYIFNPIRRTRGLSKVCKQEHYVFFFIFFVLNLETKLKIIKTRMTNEENNLNSERLNRKRKL